MSWLFTRKKQIIDADEQWSNLHRERSMNPVYRWSGSDTKSEGELHEIYTTQGEEGVASFVHGKLPQHLFNDGNGTDTIKLYDYRKFKNDQQLSLSGQQQLDNPGWSLTDDEFEEHEAQWKLSRRGGQGAALQNEKAHRVIDSINVVTRDVEGETLVHLLLMRGDPVSTEIARILLNEIPDFALDIYEADEKYGQSSLHIAILNDDYDTTKLLLQYKAKVNQRARGRFFLPEGQRVKRNPRGRYTSYEGFAYYGEYPLAYACVRNNKDIYDELIDNGADPNLQDSFGNNVLHFCVVHNNPVMYSYAAKHYKRPADAELLNGDGLTPLTLAAVLGLQSIFEKILEVNSSELVTVGDVSLPLYPLLNVDTINNDGTFNDNSALALVTEGTADTHLDMISSDFVKKIFEAKWKLVARVPFWFGALNVCMHLGCLSICIYLRELDGIEAFHETEEHSVAFNTRKLVRLVFEVLALCGTLYGLGWVHLHQQPLLINPVVLASHLIEKPVLGAFLIGLVLTLLCVPCRLLHWEVLEVFLISIALPCLWVYLLFFARGSKLFGPFIELLTAMVEGDVFRFVIVAFIMIFAFGPAFYFLCKDVLLQSDSHKCANESGGVALPSFSNFLQTFATFSRGLAVESDSIPVDGFECSHYDPLTKMFYIGYLLAVCVMLINMLIAMMGNTYVDIMPKAGKKHMRNLLQYVISLEKNLKPEKRKALQRQYAVNINDNLPDASEEMGLMVQRKMTSTWASRRRRAIVKWKRAAAKIREEVKRVGKQRAKAQLHRVGRLGTATVKDNYAFGPTSPDRQFPVYSRWKRIVTEAAELTSNRSPHYGGPNLTAAGKWPRSPGTALTATTSLGGPTDVEDSDTRVFIASASRRTRHDAEDDLENLERYSLELSIVDRNGRSSSSSGASFLKRGGRSTKVSSLTAWTQ